MSKKHNPALTQRAKGLRKAMTEQERKLWHLFLKNYPVRFMRQKVIGRFIVDFYCASAKLVVELDGSQHYEEATVEYDIERSAVLMGFGLSVMRFANKEVDNDFENVCRKIHNTVTASPQPSATAFPPRKRRGREG